MANFLKKYRQLIIQSLIALAVGGLSALLTRNGMRDFASLNQPPLSPPGRLFPVVWTILYILMGSGAGIVQKTGANIPLVYWLQLIVNFFWSIIFFNMKAYLFAFVWLLLLLALIIISVREFNKSSKTAALLQIPYIVWVCFAAYLTFAVWLLN